MNLYTYLNLCFKKWLLKWYKNIVIVGFGAFA